MQLLAGELELRSPHAVIVHGNTFRSRSVPNPSITCSELEDALQWNSAGDFGEQQAWFCRDTGKIHWHTELDDNFEELPEDIDNATRYLALPSKRDLDLGNALALQFAQEQLPDQYDDIYALLHHRHAYARYKVVLEKYEKLDAWYDYEAQAAKSALRRWCMDNDLLLAD